MEPNMEGDVLARPAARVRLRNSAVGRCAVDARTMSEVRIGYWKRDSINYGDATVYAVLSWAF